MPVSETCHKSRKKILFTNTPLPAFVSIFTAVIITMIGVGVQGQIAPMKATIDTDLFHAFTAVTNIVFAYCAHVAFFGLLAEMREPRDFPKALYMLQTFEIIFYTVAAVVIYYYAGQSVTSPALGSAGPVLKKVAYGIAIPTIIGAGVVNGHVGLKYIYVRLFRGTDRMHRRDLTSYGTWVLIGLSCWIIAWIIADAIPVFSDLLSLISSLFASWFSCTFNPFVPMYLYYPKLTLIPDGLGGVYWLHINRGRWFSSPRKIALTILNCCIVLIGGCMVSWLKFPMSTSKFPTKNFQQCGLGLYVSGKAIHDDASNNAFSCANNAEV